ncbi:MAG TPA: ATP-binding protein, partial [Steroidobacteraceae bacterium]|nr:ATP-binding protein [Steroidobacteraceae bacterium]
MSIRLQLLMIALTTLLLPWGGCRYARELDNALRLSQERALEASADTIAHALAAEPNRVFPEADDTQPFDRDAGDLYVYPLHLQPLLDGYHEDWDVAADPVALPSTGASTALLQLGSTERYLFLYLEVHDPHFVAEPAGAPPGEPGRFDRVQVTLERSDGSLETYLFASSAPGLIQAQTRVKGDDGVERTVVEPRIQAFWLVTGHGYHLEVRLPLSLVGPRLWLEAQDGSGMSAGFKVPDPPRGGRLFMSTPGLDPLLATFISSGTRAIVVDANGLKLGTAGAVGSSAGDQDDADAERAWYRRFVSPDTSSWPLMVPAPDRVTEKSLTAALAGHPAAQWLRANGGQEVLLMAAAPVKVGDDIRGAVVLEQAGDPLSEPRDRALTHLFNLTLLAAALAALFAFSVATLISLRIGRLRTAADSAVGADGRIRLEMPEAARGDEIGDLARAFERLLARLNEHTQYLRTLGGKLAHELRTPLTIVRSSLDNLESEGVRADQRGFVVRAREGVARLQSILSALGAAARVEESIKQAERVSFDVADLLRTAVAGYRDAFPASRLELEVPPDPCPMRGAPDLIAQMLDKLIENAVDFCPPGGAISVRLVRAGTNYELGVSNDGPPIPKGLLGRLFESLFEHRGGRDDKPHFGLGLYIV